MENQLGYEPNELAVTPAMREAGVEVLASFEEGDGIGYGDRVTAVFEAMIRKLPPPNVSEHDLHLG